MNLPKLIWVKFPRKGEATGLFKALDSQGMNQLADELEALVFIPVDDEEMADFNKIIKFLRT